MRKFCPECFSELIWEQDEEVWSCVAFGCGKFHGRKGALTQGEIDSLIIKK